ncbi:hypothetical protein TSAR_000846 [Trichomalopsis sarcophagae]|uniref:Bestrophin homolog n=1 Tax=Trichomalopsis sarcophagae TaxID=543379 RepID=A0A232FFC0_9HYME|nr:hypothetical protein TSAR_000846 [Trichomalopsis sarcophagae]
MTVSYQYEVASSTSGGFTRLLFMWRGSLYKLIYRELLLFLALFGTISALYRNVLSVEQKRSFEQIVVYCDTFINLIPLSFVLGFYVAYVASRWWQQYMAIPWPDKVMHSVALYVIGNDEYGRMEFNEFRSHCGLLWSYDWVSIPLVYTQVVTLATYSFFAVALVGRQYIEGVIKPFQMKVDIYFPVFTILQFFFFMGLLKVAEQLINPFGDDDEDFELNWMIDRHTKVSYLGVDTLMNRCPPLVKDIYYDSENLILPYTEAAAAYKRKTYRGSVANMTVPEEKQTMFLPNITEEEENVSTSATPRTSTASLATHNNDSPVTGKRQGGSSPLPSRRLARDTVVTLDPREDLEQQQQQQPPPTDLQQGKTQGRPSSGLAEAAVKMFSSKIKLTDHLAQGRKPFFALAKAARVNLQPWPSATNLKAEPVAGSDWTEPEMDSKSLHLQSRSFNIPSIAVRQSSVDDVLDGPDDDEDDDEEPSVEESVGRKRSQAMFDARSGQTNRGYLGREASIDETQEPYSSTSSVVSSSSRARQAVAGPSRTKKRSSKSRAARFNSFPKILVKRQRAVLPMTLPSTDSHSLSLSKSSPELRLDVELGERVRARFFTGTDDDDDDDDDDDEMRDVVVKRS